MKFKKRHIGDAHAERQDEIDGAWRHVIFKSHWQVRLLDSFLEFATARGIKIFGIIIVHSVFVHHFQYSLLEGLISGVGLGLGMGLYID